MKHDIMPPAFRIREKGASLLIVLIFASFSAVAAAGDGLEAVAPPFPSLSPVLSPAPLPAPAPSMTPSPWEEEAAFVRRPVYHPSMEPLTRSHLEGTMKIYIPQYHSRPYRSSGPVKRISVGEPKIADVVLLHPNEMLIHGRAVGSTMLMVWYRDEDGAASEGDMDVFEIRVTAARPVLRMDVEVIDGTRTDMEGSLIQWEW